jgi:4'-phosphopantetheinyl transferase
LESYYHVWTQKEAFMKASGEGLTYPLGDFCVSADTHKAGRLLSIKNEDASHWKMITLSEPGWRVAACIQSECSPKVNYYKATIQDFF